MLGTLVFSLTHPPPHLAIHGGVNSAPNGETLNVTIKGGGFTSSDRVHVRVGARGASTPLYQATVGVDPTGAVDDPITLSLPGGTYRHVQVLAWAGDAVEQSGTLCTDQGSRASC